MTRTIMNLMLVVLMCFTLTAIPINKKLFTFDFSRFFVSNNINQITDVNGVSFTYTLDESESLLTNPGEVVFKVQAESSNHFSWDEEPQLVLKITDRNGDSNTITQDGFVTSHVPDSVDQPTNYTYHLDLSKARLNLNNETYEFQIFSDNKLLEASEPIIIKASYFEDIHYVAGFSEPSNNRQCMILYFTDSQKKHLVPITRYTTTTNKVFRNTVNALLEVPKPEMGLSQDPIAPKISVLEYSSGLVTCYLKSASVIPFSDDPDLSKLTLESMTETIMNIQTPYAINKVKYLVDNQASQIFFSGTDLREPLLKNKQPRVYLGLKTTGDRVLIVPKTIFSGEMNTVIEEMIHILKRGTIENEDSTNLISILPEQAELLNYNLEGVTLKLNFNAAFNDVYASSQGLSQLMVDSLSSTFTSLEGIDNIELQVEGKTINNLGNVSFSSPIFPPKYLNVETID